MNLAYHILFHLARAIVLGPPAGSSPARAGGERNVYGERDCAHVDPWHALYGDDKKRGALQSLGGPGNRAGPLRGTRWEQTSTGRAEREPER